MKTYFVYVTCGSREEARLIASTVVPARLAACANVVPGMESLYMWKGELARDEETVLVLKTAEDRLEELRARVVELHSYEIPCVVALEIADAEPAYLAWLVEKTRPNSVVGNASD